MKDERGGEGGVRGVVTVKAKKKMGQRDDTG